MYILGDFFMKFNQFPSASKIIYVGYGQEGQSSKRFLDARFPDIPTEIYENISQPIVSQNSQEFFVISPGIDREKWLPDVPASQQTSNTELFFENLSPSQWQKTIGITGTKGKSTTTKFVSEALKISGKKVALGGNFGIPVLDLFDSLDDLDLVVCELSSFQLEHLKVSPYYAIFLNLFTDHLDRHGTHKEYFLSKQHLWNGSEMPAKHLILGIGAQKIPEISSFFSAFPPHKTTTLHLAEIFPENIFPKDSIGNAVHFRENFGTVVSLFDLLGIKNSWEILKQTAESFEGLPHRIERFLTVGGHSFYDDSISTNPQTSVAAIEYFAKDLGAIVLGGQPAGAETRDFSGVFEALKNYAPQAFVWLLDSECSADILGSAQKTKFPRKNICQGKSFADLLQKGVPDLPAKKAVVLSPGAKSFDSFSNYKVRGEQWKSAVKEYAS